MTTSRPSAAALAPAAPVAQTTTAESPPRRSLRPGLSTVPATAAGEEEEEEKEDEDEDGEEEEEAERPPLITPIISTPVAACIAAAASAKGTLASEGLVRRTTWILLPQPFM